MTGLVSNRVTEGDAEAVLNAFPNAGRVIRTHAVVQMNTPADPQLKATIRPISGSGLPFDGRHYCADDWHVIVLAELDGGDHSFTHQDAEQSLGRTVVSFVLDGAPLTATTRTPLKNLGNPSGVDPTWEKGFFFQQGELMPPGSLSVGAHSLSVTATYPGGQDQDSITFFIDPTGQGACQ